MLHKLAMTNNKFSAGWCKNRLYSIDAICIVVLTLWYSEPTMDQIFFHRSFHRSYS
ncbi:hypothetical protein CY34DRAFT_219550 [Suillus luteus UH-Slu-Lm8-n1]|uniref:Uncharacterized protein n=1 Tax=Suillus luteus UH-Slu-Lm8-n1 TaxID=930992 RepID=A0A0D0ATE1_9AGAM|nr:hypothetical protein CY34DRAFT_219550 [Suillus luteus UH-Slu-Lm8-n1]